MIDNNLELIDEHLKVCKTCKKLLSISNFHKHPAAKDNLFYSCKNCYKIYRQNNRINNPLSEEDKKKRAEKDRIWYSKNKDTKIHTHKKWRENNPRKYRNTAYKYKYGITLDFYDNQLKDQNNSCAICKIAQSELGYALMVDHCHKTNKVRGLLCRNCNLGIGYFKDNIEIIKKSINYLENKK